MSLVIYHNPRCSKSRQTLELLQNNGMDAQIVEYLKSPPDRETLVRLISMLGGEITSIVRSGESIYKEIGLDRDGVTSDEMIDAVLEHPILLQRPIVTDGERAVIGRPPENVLELIS